MGINYDFTDLEAFLAVNATGPFHLAAEKLALSQSAVTRRVQKLEAALASVLFVRTARQVRPTLAAKRLRLQARAEAKIGDARQTMRAMIEPQMAVTTGHCFTWLDPRRCSPAPHARSLRYRVFGPL